MQNGFLPSLFTEAEQYFLVSEMWECLFRSLTTLAAATKRKPPKKNFVELRSHRIVFCTNLALEAILLV